MVWLPCGTLCANARPSPYLQPSRGRFSLAATAAPPPSSSLDVRRRPSPLPTSCTDNNAALSPFPLALPVAAVGFLTWAAANSASAAEMDASKTVVEGLLSQEPANALSLPTWTIHVASVVEWVVAMALVWKYGDTPGNTAWKGLSWGMVPLLGGAMCACTWHFFYNAESLEILVALQAALTMIGNFTMWLAAYRIYQSGLNSSNTS